MLHLESIDFGRRVAIERVLANDLEAPAPNAVFDESGNFILYATLFGIKCVNLFTNKISRLLGKVENSERFLKVALFQVHTEKKKEKQDILFSCCLHSSSSYHTGVSYRIRTLIHPPIHPSIRPYMYPSMYSSIHISTHPSTHPLPRACPYRARSPRC